MEPRIQYAQTKDGVSIAYAVAGDGGVPFVWMPGVMGNLEMEWQIPEFRMSYERLAERHKLVRYDPRGSGFSERKVSDFSLDVQLLDLEAVVDRLGLEGFALFAVYLQGPVAIAYAARHPERLSHLLLWCTWARAADAYDSPQAQSIVALRDQDWTTYTETMAHALSGWSAGEPARRFAELMRESITQEAMVAAGRTATGFDVTSQLPEVKVPTLVLHRRQVPFPSVDIARGLASQIPDARLSVTEGNSLVPHLGDAEAVFRAIDEFLSEGEEAGPKTELPEGMAAIVFADIADSTSLTEQLGDAAFRDKARELDTSLRGIIRETEGPPVEGKLVGDGVLAVFTSARQAIECALRCQQASEPVGLQLHLGIHAGDVIREGNNVFGGAVNIAARIAGASAPGEVLVSDTVRGLARTSAGVAFDDRGEQSLKGVGEPQRLFPVRGGGG